MAISSYGAATDSVGRRPHPQDLDTNIAGRHVLVVEDIIDSGLTLSYLMRSLKARKPASLEICALLTKPERREIDVLGQVRRLRDPEQIRDRLRPRLRRALPQPALRRGAPSGSDSAALTGESVPWPMWRRRVRGKRLLPSMTPVNRFFRSALFPLIVIVCSSTWRVRR